MKTSAIEMSSSDIMSRIVIRFRFGRGHRVRIWLAARLAVLVGVVAGCQTEVTAE